MRTTLVAALVAAFVAVPVAHASATIEHCPEGVSDVRGTNPSWSQVNTWIEASATAHDVPAAIVKAVALRESDWIQFLPDGRVKVSSDSVCGLGIMQITADNRQDAVKLAEDPAYNIDEGTKILRAKWVESQQTAPPAGYAADDDEVLENWLYALCLYNGCAAPAEGKPDTRYVYARRVAEMVADPFRRVPSYLWKYMRPAGFTLPTDVKADYAFPSAFQARQGAQGGEFVFYDHNTGVVQQVVQGIVHLESAPPVIEYPAQTLGPDKPATPGNFYEVSCRFCGGWRLAEGAGIAGRAHWTESVTTGGTSTVTWNIEESGRLRLQAYVPALGTATLGRATYRVRPTGEPTTVSVVVDQNARKGGWVTLGDFQMNGAGGVSLDDQSTVAGQRIVADAIRYIRVPSLHVEAYRMVGNTSWGVNAVNYGESFQLGAKLLNGGTPMAGQPVKIYSRTVATTAWKMAGTWTTNAEGRVVITVKPAASVQYTARWESPTPDLVAPGVANVASVGVRSVGKASLARTVIDSGENVVVYGNVAPGHPYQQVLLQRFYSGAWRTVQTRYLNSASNTTFSYRLAIPGCCSESDHQFRIVKPADRDHLMGISAPVTVVVRDTVHTA